MIKLILAGTVRELNTSNIVLVVEEIDRGSTLLEDSEVLGGAGSLPELLSLGGSHTDGLGSTGGATEEVNGVARIRVASTATETVGVVLVKPSTLGLAVLAGGVVNVLGVIHDVTVAPQLLVDAVVRHSHGTVVGLVVGNVGLTVVVVVGEARSQRRLISIRVVTEETVELIVLGVSRVTNVVTELGPGGKIGPVPPGGLGGGEGVGDAVGPVEPSLEAVVGDLDVLDVDPLGLTGDELRLRRVKDTTLGGAGRGVTEVINDIVTVSIPEVQVTISGPVEDVGVINEIGIRLGPEPHHVVLTREGAVGVAPVPGEGTQSKTRGGAVNGVLGEGRDRLENLSGGQASKGKDDKENAHHAVIKRRKEKREEILAS